MNFLYADSEPFPPGYDFLAVFKAFILSAGKAAVLVSDIQRLERELADRSGQMARGLEALDQFASIMSRSADAQMPAGADRIVIDYAEDVRAYIRSAAERKRTELQGAMQHGNAEAQGEIESRRGEIKRVLEDFLLRAQLAVQVARARVSLAGRHYTMEALCALDGGIEVAYGVAADRLTEWQEPRKVSHFVGEMELQAGLKKKLLKRDLTREIVRVTDHFITSAVIDGDSAEFRLSKKPDQDRDLLLVRIEDGEDGLLAQIERPGADESAPFPAVPDDIHKLEQLRDALSSAAAAAMGQKQAVRNVYLDGEDVFESDRVIDLIDRFIERYAPIVSEIARRSPSARELSLKVEKENGRREEIYLKKDDLVEALAGLEGPLLSRFGKLDIFPEVTISSYTGPRPTGT